MFDSVIGISLTCRSPVSSASVNWLCSLRWSLRRPWRCSQVRSHIFLLCSEPSWGRGLGCVLRHLTCPPGPLSHWLSCSHLGEVMAADLSYNLTNPQMTLRKGSVSAKRRLERSVAESAELRWRRTRDRAGVSQSALTSARCPVRGWVALPAAFVHSLE